MGLANYFSDSKMRGMKMGWDHLDFRILISFYAAIGLGLLCR